MYVRKYICVCSVVYMNQKGVVKKKEKRERKRKKKGEEEKEIEKKN